MKISLNFLIINLALLLTASDTFAQATFIRFHFTDGTQQNFALNDVRKMDFTTSELRLHRMDASILSWNFSTIDFYRYTDTETNVDEVAFSFPELRLDVYPNPAIEELNVAYHISFQEPVTLAIYTLHGTLVVEQRLQQSEKGIWQHNLSKLPSGAYLVVIQNTRFNLSKTFIKP
ncbi:MAG: T9SS type A sorting domain-containing protein [Flavobacteriales bacterium]